MPPRRLDDVPGVIEKQNELYLKPRSPAQLIERALRLEQAGLRVDAIEYFRVAGDRAAIERVRGFAVKEGDLFLYTTACRALGESPEPEALRRLAAEARSLGKNAYGEAAEALASGPGAEKF